MTRVDLSAALITPEQQRHLPKDQYKSDQADVLIYTPNSPGASGEFARLWQEAGLPVNPGVYEGTEVVFITANGKRRGCMPPNFAEIQRAVAAGCTFVTDGRCRRPEGGNPYNIGEQEVAYFLRKAKYAECPEFDGLVCRWVPATSACDSSQDDFFEGID